MNTPRGEGARTDEGKIRAAAVRAMEALRQETMRVESLQDRFGR